MGLSVLLLSRYGRMGPSSRVRHYNYIPALTRAGIDVTVAPQLEGDYLERLYRGDGRSAPAMLKAYWRRLCQVLTARRYDLVWIEKEALPWIPAGLERLFFGKRPIVIDFDDPWHLRYAQHRNRLVRYFLGHKFESLLARANVVTTGSATLTNWAEKLAQRVVEIPCAVKIDRYPLTPLPAQPFTIGWIGTPSNVPYLALIAEPLRHLQRLYGARLRVIGATHVSLPGVQIDYVPWREDTEAGELAKCHVGLAPLANGPWEEGKCGYKIIQYMAAGRPVVASPVGVSLSIIVPGRTGFFADGTQEWISALSSLAADRERNEKMGLAARERAEAMYSLQRHTATLIEVLQSAYINSEIERAVRKGETAGVLNDGKLQNPGILTPAE